jgi:prepilin-type N-terminal cleavage/methylation domain-containing protein
MKTFARRGFTLIELLIVVVIIGILATLAIPKFGSTKDRTYQAAMKNDLRNLTTQQELYFESKGRYAEFTVQTNSISTAADSATIDTLGFRPSPYVGIAADTIQPTARYGWAWFGNATHGLLNSSKFCRQTPDTAGSRQQLTCN